MFVCWWGRKRSPAIEVTSMPNVCLVFYAFLRCNVESPRIIGFIVQQNDFVRFDHRPHAKWMYFFVFVADNKRQKNTIKIDRLSHEMSKWEHAFYLDVKKIRWKPGKSDNGVSNTTKFAFRLFPIVNQFACTGKSK